MAHRQFLWVAVLLILALSLGCQVSSSRGGPFGRMVRGSGNMVEETREIGAIDGVELATIGDLEIETGSEPELRIEAEDNLMEHLRTETRGGTLVLDIEPGINLQTMKPIRYILTVESLDTITLSSAGDARTGDLSADTFTVRVSSSGDLQMDSLSCDRCDIHLSSSGDVDISDLDAIALDVRISSSGNLTIDGGSATHQTIEISSSGDYRGSDVRSDEADVRLSSSGSARVWVEDELTGRLSSSGDLIVRGDPDIDVATSSSGDVLEE